jgi:hypothetical protein
MKQLTLILAVIPALTAAPPDPDFRHVTWGMSQAQVVATETAKPAEVRQSGSETVVKYEPVSAELTGRLIYIFVNDQLVRAKYISNAEHAEHNDFIADFHAVEPLLAEKYGKPATERAVWDNDEGQLERLPYLDQDRALASNILPSDQNSGLSVSLGYLRLYTQRLTPRTQIVHALTGGDSHVVHQIEYRSVELEALENQVTRAHTP